MNLKEITKRITKITITTTAFGENLSFESYSSLYLVKPPPKPNGIELSAIISQDLGSL